MTPGWQRRRHACHPSEALGRQRSHARDEDKGRRRAIALVSAKLTWLKRSQVLRSRLADPNTCNPKTAAATATSATSSAASVAAPSTAAAASSATASSATTSSAAASVAAPSVSGSNPYAACSGHFLLEDKESRQADVRDFLLSEDYRCSVLRRNTAGRDRGGCAARQRQRLQQLLTP